MLRPVYLHGPPVAWQIWSTNSLISRSLLVLANFRLMRSSFSWRSTTARTTAVMASVPPSRSYRERSTVPPPLCCRYQRSWTGPPVPQHRNTDNTPLAVTDSDAPLLQVATPSTSQPSVYAGKSMPMLSRGHQLYSPGRSGRDDAA